MAKNKKTSEEIKNSILTNLKEGPKTITEVSEEINSNWITVEDYLKKLRENGEVIEIVSSPKMKVYRRSDDLAFYGIPFSKKIREDTFALLCLIAKMWKKQNKTPPSRTILQKVAVEFVENSPEKINIPVLKFHYGQTLALRYDEKFIEESKKLEITPKQKEFLSGLVNKYKDYSSGEAQNEQYKKQEMKFYKTKEELLKAFSSEDSEKIIKKILELSVFYPSELEETYKLFDKFEYCAIHALSINNSKIRKEYLQKIEEVFLMIWDSITTDYFFHEAEKHIDESKKELFDYLKTNIINSKLSNVLPILEDLKSEIDAIPSKEINTETSEKSKDLLNKLLNGL